MTIRLGDVVVSGARRVLPTLVLFTLVVGVVLLLRSLAVPMSDTAQRDYGAFAIGIAAALLATRVTDFVVFDVAYPLKRDAAAPDLLRQIVRLVLFGIALGILFQVVLKASLPGLLATSAVITAVVGLALQETLGNLFSGVALATERTVQVGDMVRSGDTIGLVEQLSWRSIKVRTMEGNAILIPNSVASRERFEVFRRGGLPVARTLRVRLEYDVPPARAREALVASVRELPGLAPHPAPVAEVRTFDDFAVIYELRYWLEDYLRYLEVDSEVRERVWYGLRRAGIGFAYPIIRQHQFAAGPLARRDDSPLVAAAVGATELLRPLSAAERQRVADGARLRHYGKGETVVREGEMGSSMFLIASGRAAVSARAHSSASQKIAVLEPGSEFGEISLLTGEPRLATVRALEETVLVEIDKATLSPILQGNPSLVEKLEAVVRDRRLSTAGRLENAAGVRPSEEPESLRTRIGRFFGLKGLAG